MGVGGMKTIADPYTGARRSPRCRALSRRGAAARAAAPTRFGNCQIDGYLHMDADIARAASTVLVTTEEIVPEERDAPAS